MIKNHFFPVLSLFLLLSSSITRAQTVNLTGIVYMEQDYRVADFNSKYGDIKIIMPGIMSAAGNGTVVIRGSVTAEPTGKTESEKATNFSAMKNTSLKIAGKPIPILAGRNSFTLDLPTNLTTPVPIDLVDPMGQRVTLSFTNPVIPPAPSSGALMNDQPSLFTEQKVFLTNGNIPVYTPNNTSTLFSMSDKFFIRDASGQEIPVNVLAQSPTQTVLEMPGGITPGIKEVRRESKNIRASTKLRVASLSLSSPNTHLRNRQTSTVTATIDPGLIEKDTAEAMQIPVMSLDIRNLSPRVVSISGGNVQVMTFPKTPGSISPADWQITRTITGITPGNFNISASLTPSETTSNSKATGQKNELKTVEQFKYWEMALQKSLREGAQTMPAAGYNSNLAAWIDGLPNCRADGELFECKAAEDEIMITNFSIPQMNNALGGFCEMATLKAITENITHGLIPDSMPLHTGIVMKGFDYLKRVLQKTGSPLILKKIDDAIADCRTLTSDYNESNLHALVVDLLELNNDNEILSLMNLRGLNDTNKNTTGNAGRMRTGYLNPFTNTLWVTPGEQQTILGSLGASKLPDGKYLIHCTSYSNKPVTMTVNLKYATPDQLNKIPPKKPNKQPPAKDDKKIYDYVIGEVSGGEKKKDQKETETGKDNYDFILEAGSNGKIIGGEWMGSGKNTHPDFLWWPWLKWKFVDEESSKQANDKKMELSGNVTDNTGTVYEFYKNAACVNVTNEHTEVECGANKDIGTTSYVEEAEKNFNLNLKTNNANHFMKFVLFDRKKCADGKDDCYSKLMIVGLKYVYADKECRKLVEVVKVMGFACEGSGKPPGIKPN